MFLDDENARRALKASESRATFLIALAAATACVLMVFGLMGVANAGVPIVRDSVVGDGGEMPQSLYRPVELASLAVSTATAQTGGKAVLTGLETRQPQAAINERTPLMAAIAGAFALILVGSRALWRNHVSKPFRAEFERRRK